MNHEQDPLEMMRAGVDLRFPIRLNKFEALFRPLSNLELTIIATDTANQLRKQPELGNSRMAESVLYAIKMLSRATTPSPHKLDQVVLTEAILQELTPDELSYLNKEYQAVIERVNPALQELDSNEIENIIERLKKKEIRSVDLSFVCLANVCEHLLMRT